MKIKRTINPLYLISWVTFIGFSLIVALIGFFGFTSVSRLITIPVRLGISILMVASIFAYKYKPNRNSLTYILFFLFFLIYLIKVLTEIFFGAAQLYNPAYEFLFYSVFYVIIPFMYFAQEKAEQDYNLIFKAIYNSGIIFVLFSIIVWLSILIDRGAFWRSLIPFSSLVMSYTSIILFGVCISKLIFEELSKADKKKMYYGVVLAIIPIIISGSRGAILAMILSLLFGIIYYNRYKIRLRYLFWALLFSIGLYVLAQLIFPQIIERFMVLFERASKGESANVRIDIWRLSFSQFLNSPIFGDSLQTDKGGYPHNLWIEALMATGLVGFLPFLLLSGVGIKQSLNVLRFKPKYGWMVILYFQAFINAVFSGAIYSSIDFFVGLALVFSINLRKE